jgi:hypothetical protein
VDRIEQKLNVVGVAVTGSKLAVNRAKTIVTRWKSFWKPRKALTTIDIEKKIQILAIMFEKKFVELEKKQNTTRNLHSKGAKAYRFRCEHCFSMPIEG